MDDLTLLFKDYHAKLFAEHGATPRGVDWNDEVEMLFRYSKLLEVLDMDFYSGSPTPSLLDVGCGWGGLLEWAHNNNRDVVYTGIDVVESMIDYSSDRFPGGSFIHGDVFDLDEPEAYDFVVCNAILTQRLTASITEMDEFAKRLIRKMFELCKHGIAFNLISNQVNFTVPNLFYKSPLEMLENSVRGSSSTMGTAVFPVAAASTMTSPCTPTRTERRPRSACSSMRSTSAEDPWSFKQSESRPLGEASHSTGN